MARAPQTISYSTGGALAVVALDATGTPTYVTSVAGTVVASVPGQVTVTASVIGALGVTQTTSPWIQDPIRYAMRVDYSSGGNPRYIGRAVAGASETASVWQIEQCSFNGSGQFLAKTWPQSGGTAFTFPWSGRAGIAFL